MKIAVTGAGGFLGSRITEYYQRHEFQKGETNSFVKLCHEQVDFQSPGDVMAFWKRERPELLIHCAAVSDTGTCDREPERTGKINVQIPELLSKICADFGTKMIFCSSDQVYAGSPLTVPHRETEELHPTRAYAMQKLEAEEKILRHCPGAVALRLSWMYDTEIRGAEHGTLYTTIAGALKEGTPLQYPIHDFRSITNVWEIVRNLKKAASLPGGIYNFGSENDLCTYEVAQKILLDLGQDLSMLTENREAFADCPRNLRMNLEKAESHDIFFHTTEEGIRKKAIS